MISEADRGLGPLRVDGPGDVKNTAESVGRRLRADRWRIGQLLDPARLLDVGAQLEVDWFPTPRRGTWVADPIPLGHTTIVCEEFAYHRACGQLVELEIASHRLERRQVLDGLVGHASYPWLVEDEGVLYVIPEQSHRQGVLAYRYGPQLGAPIRLIANVQALDTTIIHHEQAWYAFFSTLAGGIGGNDLEVWSAPRFIGPWRRVPYLPPTDAPVHRPAGTPFVLNGHLIRPSQDCTRTYGGSLRLNAVERLDPGGFAEQHVATVALADHREGAGVHTLSIRDGLALVDAKTSTLRLDALYGRARRRAARFLGGRR